MVKVKLAGLKIARARGKYYVYFRATGEALLRGFDGDSEALYRRLSMPDMLGAYNVRRRRAANSYPEKTLGWLVNWYTTECPEFKDLGEKTKEQYQAGYAYLESEFDAPLDTITQPSLYAVRDQCVKDKWPTFADKMMTGLSSMFTRAVKRGFMGNNPAIGIERARKPNHYSNREWLPQEWETVIALAPPKFKVAFMLARHIGYRSQSLARLQWSGYQMDPVYGKCFRMTHKKNNEQNWLPASPELQEFLDGLERTSTHVATKHNGTPWRDEEQLQKAVSNFLKGLEREGKVGAGLTLHGLRVTYAAALRRSGAQSSDVAAALGDRDERMGEHYTRHVENEARVVRAFGPPKGKK